MQVIAVGVPYTQSEIDDHRNTLPDDFTEAIAGTTRDSSQADQIVEDLADWLGVETETVVLSPNFQQLTEMYVLMLINKMITTLKELPFFFEKGGEKGAWVAVIDVAQLEFPGVKLVFEYK